MTVFILFEDSRKFKLYFQQTVLTQFGASRCPRNVNGLLSNTSLYMSEAALYLRKVSHVDDKSF